MAMAEVADTWNSDDSEMEGRMPYLTLIEGRREEFCDAAVLEAQIAATNHVRRIVEACRKYMRQTRRKKLRCVDVNEVAKMCDIPPVLGLHSGMDDPSNKLRIPEMQAKSIYSISGSWNAGKDILSRRTVEKAARTQGNSAEVFFTVVDDDDSMALEELNPTVPNNIINSFAIICKALTSNLSLIDLKAIYEDLSCNDKILPIVPFMLKFLALTLTNITILKNVNVKMLQLQRVLRAVEALTENQLIDFRPYYQCVRVSNALIRIIKSADISYDVNLRLRVAEVLAKVVKKWCSGEHRDDIIDDAGKLVDENTPTHVLVGAAKLLRDLGPGTLRQKFWPHLRGILARLDAVEQNVAQGKHSPESLNRQEEMNALRLVTLEAAQVLYKTPPNDDETERLIVQRLDEMLYEHFGPSICPLRANLMMGCVGYVF